VPNTLYAYANEVMNIKCMWKCMYGVCEYRLKNMDHHGSPKFRYTEKFSITVHCTVEMRDGSVRAACFWMSQWQSHWGEGGAYPLFLSQHNLCHYPTVNRVSHHSLRYLWCVDRMYQWLKTAALPFFSTFMSGQHTSQGSCLLNSC